MQTTKRRTRRRAAVVTLMSVLSIFATALPALAHHPEVQASSDCADGQIRVDFTAVTWSATGTGGLHDDIRVGWSTTNPGSGTSQSAPYTTFVADGEYTDANGRQFSGHFFRPLSDGGSTIYVTVWAVGSWGNGNSGYQYRTVAVTLPTDCEPTPVEPVPSGSLTSECGVWSASVSVASLGQHEVAVPPTVTFQVWEGASLLDEVELAPGESDTLGGTFPEDSGVRDIRLVVLGGDQLDTAAVETDCESAPEVTLGDECAEGGIAVLLSNPDAPTASFEVWSGDTLVETVQLSGTTEPYLVIVPALEGETVDITVWVDDGEGPFAAYEVTRDCEPPVVVVETCTPDGSLMVNVSELPADTFTIVVDGASLAEPIERTSEGAVTDYTEYFDLEDGIYVVTVYDSSEEPIWTDTVVVDCDEPVVEVAAECATDGGTVTVTVTETPDGEAFTATISETTVDVVDGVATFEGLADGIYEVLVESDEGYEEVFEVVVDCDEPVVEVAAECATDGGTVTVTVTETPDGEAFTATIGDTTVDVVDGVATFEGLADGIYEVLVESDEGYEEVFEVAVDCEEPVVEVAQECILEDGTVTVTVTETPDDETFTVTIDGVEKPVADGTVTFEDLADGTYDVTVTSDQGYDETFVVTIDCDVDTDVGGEEVEQPAPEPEPEPEPAPTPAPAPTPQAPTLAMTGVDGLSLMALAAAVLMLLGALVLLATRGATGIAGSTDMRLGMVRTPERTNPSLSPTPFVTDRGTTATAPRPWWRWRPHRRG